MIRKFLLLFAVAAAGCASTRLPEAGQVRPVLVQYSPGQNGGVRLTAPYQGVLTQRGPCLGLLNEGIYTVIIWPETARLSFDRRGLLLRDAHGGATVRLGDRVVITGGPLPPGTQHQLGSPPLAQGMPIECAGFADVSRHDWIGVANRGFRKGRSEPR